MSPLIPQRTIEVVKTFNDLTVGLVGIDCTLYIPTNLTSIESKDMYATVEDVTYIEYQNQKVWIEWAGKNIERLRKLGVFTENDLSILGRFKNEPEVIMGSYIKVPLQYIPGNYDVDEFEVVNVIINNTYNNEIFRWFKMAPKRTVIKDKI